MIIAKEKYKANIIEYILYMWQIEDLLRAKHLDRELIKKDIVDKFERPLDEKTEILEWYCGIAVKMEKDGITENGHLAFLNDTVAELNDLHLNLLNDLNDERYRELYGWAKDSIRIFKQKAGNPGMLEIEACLQGLYGLLMMRLQGKTVSVETMESMSAFSNLLAYLNIRYFELCRNTNL